MEFAFKVSNEFLEQLTESYEIFRKSIVDIQSVNTKDAKVIKQHLISLDIKDISDLTHNVISKLLFNTP